MWVRLCNKLHFVFRRGRFDRELGEEMDFHRQMLEVEKTRQGLAREAAAVGARRQLGNTTLACDYSRDVWIIAWLDTLIADVRYALRTIAANKTFSALAILSLALGIGANTAIYSFMESILLRSLPVSDPASLVMLHWHTNALGRDSVIQRSHGRSGYKDPNSGFTSPIFPFAAFELLQKFDPVFSSVFGYYEAGDLDLTIQGQADVAHGEFVTGDYFRGLGVPPAAGRLLLPDDDRAGAPAVAVVSRAFSERRFGGAAEAAGQSILINTVPFTVVGVTPPEFFGVNPNATPDFYLPMHTSLLLPDPRPPADWYLDKNTYWIEITARLRPGVSLAQAQATLAEPFHQWVESTATTDQQLTDLPSLAVKEGARGPDGLRRQYSKPLYLLMTLVGLILAIACANIANLLLARAAARRREMALRLSIGAGRLRVVRQLLTESVVLASLGGILGVLFAIWGIRFLTLLLASGQANFTLRADMNWQVLGVAAALSLLTGVLFGLAPAIRSTRMDLMPALKEIRANRAPSRFRVSLSHVLVVSQIAMSLLMLFAAGLFVRTLSNLHSVELGFNRENVLLFQLNARRAGHRDPEIASFYSDLQKRFSAIPGVRNVSLSTSPLVGVGWWFRSITVSGTPVNGDPRILTVGPAFFTTMQIPMLLGREIDERDQRGSPPVAVVNALFAKANFGNQNPVGRHLGLGGRAPRDAEIIGVSTDARYGYLNEDVPPAVYVPYKQESAVGEMTYALRTTGDPLTHVNTIREIVHLADPLVPVTNVSTQAKQIDGSINQEIIFARLCTGFAILALVIACVGLYGTVAYNVARRTGEIGIRIALGAQPGAVVWMVLREVFVLAAVGLGISVPIAFGTSKFVESFLFGMKPNDPLALTLAVAILLIAALLAGYAPARKASRIDPMIALRHD